MSREKTPLDGLVRSISASPATPEVSPACTAINPKKSAVTGAMVGSDGRTLSMREFFEAGGRAYEVYLSYQDRQKVPDSHVLPPRCPLSPPTKDNQKPTPVDQLPSQIPDVAAKAPGSCAASINPSVLTVVHVTATSGPPTSSLSGYTHAPIGQRSHGHFSVTSQGPKAGAPPGYIAADVIDRIISSRLNLQESRGSLLAIDAFGKMDEKRTLYVRERPTKPVITPLSTLSETFLLTTSSVTSSPPSPLASISTTAAAPPSTTSCPSNVEEGPSNVIDLRDNCPKRKLTAAEDPDLVVVDLSSKRRKSGHDSQCGAVNQSNGWQKEATPIDRQKPAKIEADGNGVTRPSVAGTVPKVAYQSATIFSDVRLWSVDQVVRFVANVQGCREYAEIFRQEEIDGACLIRLSESHMLNVIRMKLGPVLRLRQAITSLCSIDAI